MSTSGDLIIGVGSLIAGVRTLAGILRRPALGTRGLGAPRGRLVRGLDLSRPTAEVQRQALRTMVGRRQASEPIHNVRTLDERVRHIARMTLKGADDPDVRMTTARLLSRKCGGRWCIPERDWSGEVHAIFGAVREHLRYTRDPEGTDLFQHPVRAFQTGGADCDDQSIALCSMLMSVGYPVRLRVIRSRGEDDWNHIYALVGLPPGKPTRWVPLDTTVPGSRPGWQPPRREIAACRDFAVRHNDT